MAHVTHQLYIGNVIDKDKHSWNKTALAVKFRDLYQPNLGYMSRLIILLDTPRKNDDGPGPTHYSSRNSGSFNVDVNQMVEWKESIDQRYDDPPTYTHNCSFVTVEPRKDLDRHYGPGTMEMNMVTFEESHSAGSIDLSTISIIPNGRIPVDQACDRIQSLSVKAFRPIYDRVLDEQRREIFDRWTKSLSEIKTAARNLEDVLSKGMDAIDPEKVWEDEGSYQS